MPAVKNGAREKWEQDSESPTSAPPSDAPPLPSCDSSPTASSSSHLAVVEAKCAKKQSVSFEGALNLQWRSCRPQQWLLGGIILAWRLAVAQERLGQAHQENELSRMDAEDSKAKLERTTEQLDNVRKDLTELCLCPVSMEIMSEPMLGPDLRTYQKDVIEKALEVKPASPFTRAYMDKGSLRPNMLAASLLDLTFKHFHDSEASMIPKPPRPSRTPPVGQELLDALQRRDSQQAVELLGRDVDFKVLNTGYLFQSVEMNLLQLCISLDLPSVACAIIDRPDFRRTEGHSSEGLQAIHMAAAFHQVDVCRKIMADVGVSAIRARTLQATKLVDCHGRSEQVPQGSSALDCARLFGHKPDWATS